MSLSWAVAAREGSGCGTAAGARRGSGALLGSPSTDTMGNVGEQVTLQKSIASANLQPGIYRIDIKVSDNVSKQTIDPSATFAVE